MSTLRVWDMTELPQAESDKGGVPCDPAGDTAAAPRPGLFLYVTNGRRRSREVRIQYPGTIVSPEPGDVTFRIKGRARMMFGTFGPHFEGQPDPEVRISYPGGSKGLRVIAVTPAPDGTTITTRSPVFGYDPA